MDDIGHGDDSLGTAPKAPDMKEMTGKLDFTTFKTSALQKTMVKV